MRGHFSANPRMTGIAMSGATAGRLRQVRLPESQSFSRLMDPPDSPYAAGKVQQFNEDLRSMTWTYMVRINQANQMLPVAARKEIKSGTPEELTRRRNYIDDLIRDVATGRGWDIPTVTTLPDGTTKTTYSARRENRLDHLKAAMRVFNNVVKTVFAKYNQVLPDIPKAPTLQALITVLVPDMAAIQKDPPDPIHLPQIDTTTPYSPKTAPTSPDEVIIRTQEPARAGILGIPTEFLILGGAIVGALVLFGVFSKKARS